MRGAEERDEDGFGVGEVLQLHGLAGGAEPGQGLALTLGLQPGPAHQPADGENDQQRRAGGFRVGQQQDACQHQQRQRDRADDCGPSMIGLRGGDELASLSQRNHIRVFVFLDGWLESGAACRTPVTFYRWHNRSATAARRRKRGSGTQPRGTNPVETPQIVRPEPARVKPIIQLLDYQREDVEADDRFRWCCWSRQVGKSFTKSLRRLLRGLLRQRTQIMLSAGERQSRELMAKARQHCQALRIAADFRGDQFFTGTRFKQLEIALPNGVRIIALPANPQTARGFTGDVLLDEFSLHADDRAIWAAMFPTLLRGDGELDVASTPRGKNNVFYRLSQNPAFAQSIVTLSDAVKAGLPVEIEQVRSAMNDDLLFRQEFGCEFLDETTAFLTYEMISACEDPSLEVTLALRDARERQLDLYAGVDIGRRHDLTVIWVVSREGDELLTRGVRTMAGCRFREQYDALRQVLSQPGLRRCCIDAGGLGMQLAEAAVEDFGSHRVEPLTFTRAVKEQLAGGLRVAVEEQRIRIPIDESIRNDWHSVQRTVTPAGHVRYDAERTGQGHGDRFWAAALAVHAAQTVGGPAESAASGPLRFSRPGIW